MLFKRKQPSKKHYSQLHSYDSFNQNAPCNTDQPRMSGISEEDESATDMAGTDLAVRTGRLARLANALSTGLNHVEEACSHEVTKQEIRSVATELTFLASTLWRLQEAVNQEPNHYTQAFHQDLTSILNELKLCFDEVSECCGEMRENDDPENVVPWFFTKGRVVRLAHHLAALKTTLVTMRTVLWDGKENAKGIYGHALTNERYIIESTFSRNKNAILDVSALEHEGAAAERNSQIIGLEVQAATSETSNGTGKAAETKALAIDAPRRFTDRNRPAIHDSLLAIHTANSISRLNEMWIEPEAHYHEAFAPTQSSFDASYSQSTIGVLEGAESSGELTIAGSASGMPAPGQGNDILISRPSTAGAVTIDGTADQQGIEPVQRQRGLMGTSFGRAVKKTCRKLVRSRQNTAQTSIVEQVPVAREAPVIRPYQRPGLAVRFLRGLWGLPSNSPITSSDFEDTENMQSGLA